MDKVKIFGFSFDIFLEFFVNLGLFITSYLKGQESNNKFPASEEILFQLFVFDIEGIKEFCFKSFVNVLDDFLVFLDSTVDVSPVTVVNRLDQDLLNIQFKDLEQFSQWFFVHYH